MGASRDRMVDGAEGVKPGKGLARAALVLAALTGILIAFQPVRCARFVLGFAYRGPMVDESLWRGWTERNRGLFGPLRPGAALAIVEDPRDSTGILVQRTEAGLEVDRTHFLWLRRVPVVLAMAPPTALELLALSLDSDKNRLWDLLKLRTREGDVRCYRFGDPDRLERTGLAAFLASFDMVDLAAQ